MPPSQLRRRASNPGWFRGPSRDRTVENGVGGDGGPFDACGGKRALGLSGRVPGRVDAATKTVLIDLVDGAVAGGWSMAGACRYDPADRPRSRPINRFASPACHRFQTSITSASVNLTTTTSSIRDNTLTDRCCIHPQRPQPLCAGVSHRPPRTTNTLVLTRNNVDDVALAVVEPHTSTTVRQGYHPIDGLEVLELELVE